MTVCKDVAEDIICNRDVTGRLTSSFQASGADYSNVR
jgi:hypothetical protein